MGRQVPPAADVGKTHCRIGQAGLHSALRAQDGRGPATTLAAAADGLPGGLTGDRLFTSKFTQALHDRGLRPVHPAGDALVGAAALASRTDLLHERYAIRVRPQP